MFNQAIPALVDGLKLYLTAALAPAGVVVLGEWPDANQELKMPSLTIFSGEPKYMNRPPEQVSVTDPDANHQVVVTEIVGEYDTKFQLDLWCANKLTRNQILGQLLTALNPDESTMGLSLKLDQYFGEWVRFDLDGHVLVDDDAGAQRRERRAKIDLLVNCRAIRQRVAYAIINIEAHIGVGLTDNDTSQAETVEI